MLVKDVMDHHPVTINLETSVDVARQLMRERHISAIPVLDNNILKGLATHNSLMINPDLVGSHDLMELSEFLAELKIKRAMIKGPDLITISPDKTVEEASHLMLQEKVGCLPVVNEKLLVGLITRGDLLVQLTEMMAINMPSTRATVRMPMIKGEMAKLVCAISNAGLGIMCSGVIRDRSDAGYVNMVIKIRNTTVEDLESILKDVPDQRIIDIRSMS
jgi:acetoin utilization protein AcuB